MQVNILDKKNKLWNIFKKNPSSLESIRGSIIEQKIIRYNNFQSYITNKKINEDQYKKLEEETFDINKDKL